MRVLIVDDEIDGRRLLRHILEHHGCDVSEAADGIEGLEAARADKPDIIITDALMPRMDGFHFLRAIKSDERLRDIPAVFYSATYTGTREMDFALSLGASGYITKPKTPDEFWQELSLITGRMLQNAAVPPKEDEEFLKGYAGIVTSKLEEKVKELEGAVSLLKANEKELSFLASILRNIPEAVCAIDLAGNINVWNTGAERIFEYKEEEIIGRHIKTIIPEEIASKELEHCISTLNRDGYMREYETERVKKSGQTVPVELTGLALKDGKNNITGYCSIMRDITERKRSEEEINRRVKELEDFYKMAVGRELRMKELKEELAAMREELSKCRS